jgi:FixJ family two-component response regulator
MSVSTESAVRTETASKTAERMLLVVDDEPNILRSLKRLVRKEPYSITTVDSGPAAIEVLEQQQVQILITDQRMPEMAGTELCRIVGERWPHVTRMILSGYSDVDTILDAINEGQIYKFLTKPWNDEELRLHVRRAFEQWELAHENRRLSEEIEDQNKQLRELNSRLDQKASDASRGLEVNQNILDGLAAGIFTIDLERTIVYSNSFMIRSFQRLGKPLFGGKADRVLPSEFSQALFPAEPDAAPHPSGCCLLDGVACEWRALPMKGERGVTGYNIVLWSRVLDEGEE